MRCRNLGAFAVFAFLVVSAVASSQAQTTPASGNAQQGKELYAKYSCYACHGYDGHDRPRHASRPDAHEPCRASPRTSRIPARCRRTPQRCCPTRRPRICGRSSSRSRNRRPLTRSRCCRGSSTRSDVIRRATHRSDAYLQKRSEHEAIAGRHHGFRNDDAVRVRGRSPDPAGGRAGAAAATDDEPAAVSERHAATGDRRHDARLRPGARRPVRGRVRLLPRRNGAGLRFRGRHEADEKRRAQDDPDGPRGQWQARRRHRQTGGRRHPRALRDLPSRRRDPQAGCEQPGGEAPAGAAQKRPIRTGTPMV